MIARVSGSGNIERRGQGRRPYVNIALEPEGEVEKALLRTFFSAQHKVFVWSSGNAEIQFVLPRGKQQ